MSKTHWYIDDEDEEDAYNHSGNLKNSKLANTSLTSLKDFLWPHSEAKLMSRADKYQKKTQEILKLKEENVNEYLKSSEVVTDSYKRARLKASFENTNKRLETEYQNAHNKMQSYTNMLISYYGRSGKKMSNYGDSIHSVMSVLHPRKLLNLSLNGKKSKSVQDLSPNLDLDINNNNQPNKLDEKDKLKTKTKRNTSIFHISTEAYNANINNNDDEVDADDKNDELLKKNMHKLENLVWNEMRLKIEESRLKSEESKLDLREIQFRLDSLEGERRQWTELCIRKEMLQKKLHDMLQNHQEDMVLQQTEAMTMCEEFDQRVEEANKKVHEAITECYEKLSKIENENSSQQVTSVHSNRKLWHMLVHSTNQVLELLASLFVFIAAVIAFCCELVPPTSNRFLRNVLKFIVAVMLVGVAMFVGFQSKEFSPGDQHSNHEHNNVIIENNLDSSIENSNNNDKVDNNEVNDDNNDSNSYSGSSNMNMNKINNNDNNVNKNNNNDNSNINDKSKKHNGL